MTHTHPISASIGIELTLNLTGVYIPTSSADRGQPEGGEYVEDVVIDAVLFEEYETVEACPEGVVGVVRTVHRLRPVDLLANVDTSCPHVQTLLSNLLACVNDAAEEALLAEVGE